ncbi:MAG: hypothetical protein LQ340_005548, partial [Diploschistes diacapsis]
MDQPENGSHEDSKAAGYVSTGAPDITRRSDELDPRMNSVYAQISGSNPFLGSIHQGASDEEMRGTVFPSYSARAATPYKASQEKTSSRRQRQKQAKEHTRPKGYSEVPREDLGSPNSAAGEWITAYDDIVTPGYPKSAARNFGSPETYYANNDCSQRRMSDDDYANRTRGYSQPPQSKDSSRRSPTKVTFASPSRKQTPHLNRNVETQNVEMLQTRRANVSPTRYDMNFKPLPQSPHPSYSDQSTLNSAQLYEYLAPEPLNIPNKNYGQRPPQMATIDRRGSDTERTNWFKANNLPELTNDIPRETVWFQPQPPTRFYTGDDNNPYTFVDNPPIVYHQVEGGPAKATIGDVVVARKQNGDPPRGDRDYGEAILNHHEYNRLQSQSQNSRKHHMINSDVSEYGSYHRPQGDGSRNRQELPLIKSQSQKQYRVTPPEISEYDRVPDLEQTPGGHTRVVRGEDRSSGSTYSGPRGRSVIHPRRSRSLSPAKKSFDTSGLNEDDEYVFCDEDAPLKRSRSPMKQMFGDKGWLHRGNSMNQVAHPSPRKNAFKEIAKFVRQKTDDK